MYRNHAPKSESRFCLVTVEEKLPTMQNHNRTECDTKTGESPGIDEGQLPLLTPSMVENF